MVNKLIFFTIFNDNVVFLMYRETVSVLKNINTPLIELKTNSF